MISNSKSDNDILITFTVSPGREAAAASSKKRESVKLNKTNSSHQGLILASNEKSSIHDELTKAAK